MKLLQSTWLVLVSVLLLVYSYSMYQMAMGNYESAETQYNNYWDERAEEQENWKEWVAERERSSNRESWDVGNKVTFDNGTNRLECEFGATGYVVIIFNNSDDENVTVSGGSFDEYKTDNYTWNYTVIVGLGTVMTLHIYNNSFHSYPLEVVLYRDSDPFYHYRYPVLKWEFEVRT